MLRQPQQTALNRNSDDVDPGKNSEWELIEKFSSDDQIRDRENEEWQRPERERSGRHYIKLLKEAADGEYRLDDKPCGCE